MKTKFNRILSSLLLAVMLFASVSALIPVSAGAAYIPDVSSTAQYTGDEVKAIAAAALEYDFETAEEMLLYELCDKEVSFDRDGDGTPDVTYTKQKDDEIDITGNYLNSVTSTDLRYTMYANNYTGYFYYKDNLTGQIITSNPYNVKSLVSSIKEQLAGQIDVSFSKNTGVGADTTYSSYQWATLYSQISTTKIANGIRVNYTLGDTTTRFLLPGGITAECFDEYIAIPLIETYIDLLNEYTGETYSFFENDDYTAYNGEVINFKGYKAPNPQSVFDDIEHKGFLDFMEDTLEDAAFSLSSKQRKELTALADLIDNFAHRYNFKNPLNEKAFLENYQAFAAKPGYTGIDQLIAGQQEILDGMYEESPITEEDVPVYMWNDKSYGAVLEKRIYSGVIVKYCPEFNFTMLYEQEDLCGYVNVFEQKPVFRCCLEYTFNEDGSLSIALPSSSIIFDETTYALKSITPLKFFGAGEMKNCKEGGYVFYPDGSGAIIDYNDFYATGINVQIQSQIFGQDYCYSSVSGAHREQVSVPVYGVVSAVRTSATTKANTSTDAKYVKNGYFAIIEEGASLAKLGVTTVADFMSVYTSYVPYALDVVQNSSVSVSGVVGYVKVTESKYSGSYVTRIVMLNDPELDSVIPAGEAFYPSTYSGMASYYRNYLKSRGVLTALENTGNDLPLYIEVLGALQVTEKFLTFPVTVSKPLTTFEDVEVMYNELLNAKQTFAAKSDEYKAMAEAITSDTNESKKLITKYNNYAALYDELSQTLDGITKINFKLSGFSNGGLTATYPVKLKWERVCGGKSGFKSLIDAAKAATGNGATFGVYPDFDFMYVNSTALFDGIGIKQIVSRKVDNRYASKQEYNAVTGSFDMLRSMVVSADMLPELFDKFLKKYSAYDWKYISASTLGSDLNSNFDEDNPIDRDTANKYVVQTLGKLGEYKVMVDKGNIYSVAYADHILDATIDSSHFRYSSYAVPFLGLVLHSYVNYTGSAFNYTGSPDYEMLRAIESGASLYYILCYENTSYLKEDHRLNKYYGIDYKNWFDSIVKSYNELNAIIGDLQYHEIVDHKALIAERHLSDEARLANLKALVVEILGFIKAQTHEAIDTKFDEFGASNPEHYESIKVSFDLAAIKAQVVDTLYLDSASELDEINFDALFAELVQSKFDAEYPTVSTEKQYELVVSDFEYQYNDAKCPLCDGALNAENKCTKLNALRQPDCANYDVVVYKYRSAYSYVTGSGAEDTRKEYKYTNYTCNNGNVVLVTYQLVENGVTKTTKFIINYNSFAVDVRLDGVVYPISKYGYYEINE